MTAFFFSRVLPLSLTGAAVSALILAVSFLTRRQFGSRWRYYIWLVALALFFLPVTLPFPAGALSGVSEAISPAAAAVRFAAGPPTAAAETAAASAPLSWRELAALAWACGAAALLLQRAWAALRFHRALRRTSRPVADRETLALFAACKEELRVRRAVRLERCPLAGTPMLVGLLRPRVLLPDAPADPDALRFILLHELTHLKSGDLFYKLAGLAACVVHWFNPFAWLALHRINALCEPACDERLARPMDADERRGYGRAILGAMGTVRAAPPLSTPFSLHKEDVKRRLTLMMNCKKSTRVLLAAAVCSAALLGFVGMSISTFLIAPAEAASPSESSRLLAPSPERLAKELAGGVVFDFESGELRIAIPDELPDGWAWSIHPAGQAAMGDGAMSVHWFEAESAANDWRPGGTYTAPIGGELLSYDVEFALLDGAGRERAAGSLSWDADESASTPAVIGGADGPTSIIVAPRLTPPLAGLTVAAPFDKGLGHKGVDYRAEPGEAVFAAADGTVSEAGWEGVYGYRVVLDHGDGFQTLYAHCRELAVAVGDAVAAGQRIASAGSTGNAAGPCLHFEVRLNGEPVEPPAFSFEEAEGSAPQPGAGTPNLVKDESSSTLIED